MATSISIPRVVFQTGRTEQIRPEWQSGPPSVRKYFPAWRYEYYTDDAIEAYVRTHYPQELDFFHSLKYGGSPIKAVDFWRYLKLYRDGGLYLDLDYEVLQPFESMFTTKSDVWLLPSSNDHRCFTNSMMASVPGARLWPDVIARCHRGAPIWTKVSDFFDVMYHTGPRMLNEVVRSRGLSYYHVSVLPAMKLAPLPIDMVGITVEGAMTKQLPGDNWHKWDTKVLNWLYCQRGYLVFLTLLLILIVLVLFTRRKRR